MKRSEISTLLFVAGTTAGLMTWLVATTPKASMFGSLIAVILCCIGLGIVIADEFEDDEQGSKDGKTSS